MASVKIKTKSSQDKELGDIFNQIIGAGKLNMTICVPKFIELLQSLRKVTQILDIFTNKSVFFNKLAEHSAAIDEFNDWISEVTGSIESASMDLAPYSSNYEAAPDEVRVEFTTKYNALKSCEEISSLVKLCDNLIPYKKFISDSTNLNHKFLIGMPGVDYRPFPWSSFNIKQAVVSLDLDSSKEARCNIELLMLVLNKLFNISHNIYRVISSPDVDISEFVDVVMTKIVELRKRVPRCTKAFDKLVESVNLLKNNFNTYYRDFVETQTGTIIIENFVLDVAKNTKADPLLMKQFRDIVSYIRKAAGTQINNPQAKVLFDKLNEQFSKFDKFSNIRADDSTPADDSDPEPEGPVPIEDEWDEVRAANADKSVDELADEIGDL